MGFIHILFAIIIALIWGTNFVSIKLAYDSFPPFLLLALRFTLTVFPLIFFVPKPKASWKYIVMIALFLWIGQFSFLFVGMYMGAPAGLTSLILQAQTIFTMIFSVMWLHYRPHRGEVIGLTIAALALIGIALERFTEGSWIGIAVVFPAAICVSVSNILFAKHKTEKPDHPLAMVVWSSLIPPIPMFIASYLFEGPDALSTAWDTLTFVTASSLAYTTYFSTLIATSLWAFLLRHHTPSQVVPFTLLIPIFGMGASMIFLKESYTSLSLCYAGIVLVGLGVNQLSRRRIPKQPLRKIS
tara:strand:+ start:1170 stop:2066 length:897 start_codon:yes stop_codon:yes gene_type:complete